MIVNVIIHRGINKLDIIRSPRLELTNPNVIYFRLFKKIGNFNFKVNAVTNKEYRILVLLAHPSLHHSTVNRYLKKISQEIESVTVHDLYDAYPEFYIDMKYEQQLLSKHDLVVFQHPLYWYSTTPILKLWQDVVLSRGFAYGTDGTALQGKHFIQVISTGGKEGAYQSEGYNGFSVDELLAPMKATINMCGMIFHQPLVLHHSYEVTKTELTAHGDCFKDLLLNYTQNGADCFKLEKR